MVTTQSPNLESYDKMERKNDKLLKQFPNPIAKSQKEEKSHDRSVFGLGTSTYTRLMAQRE